MKLFTALLLLLIPFTSFKNKDKVPPHKDVISEGYTGDVKKVIGITYGDPVRDSILNNITAYKTYDSTLIEFDENGFLKRLLRCRKEDGYITSFEHERYYYEPSYKKATIEVLNKYKQKVLTRYLTWVGNHLKTIQTYTDDSAVIRIDSIYYNKDYRTDSISKKHFDINGNFEIEYFTIIEFNEYGGVKTMIVEVFGDINRKNLLARLVLGTSVLKTDIYNNVLEFELKTLVEGKSNTSRAIQKFEYYK